MAVMAQHLIPMLSGAGRLPAVEVLMATDAVRNLIRTGKTHQIYSAISTSKGAGMQTLEESLASLVRRHAITLADAQLRTVHPEELAALLR